MYGSHTTRDTDTAGVPVHSNGKILMWRNTADSRTWLLHGHVKQYETLQMIWQGTSFHANRYFHSSNNKNEANKTYKKVMNNCGKQKLI